MGGLCFLSIFTAMILTSQAQYLLPITKDEFTKQFYTTLNIGAAVKSELNLLLDLGTNLTWLSCDKLESLISIHNVACGSDSCEYVPGNGCNDYNACLYQQPNPLGSKNITGRVVQDTAFFSTTDGRNFISQASLRIFTFSCGVDNDLQGLAPQVAGALSLSPGSSSFTAQVASELDDHATLALCLPSSGTGRFYVAGVYYTIPPFISDNPIPKTLTSMKTDSGDYIITVQSMYVDGTPLTLSPNLLLGGVGAKLSTMVPYTVLHTDIYNALAQSFTLKAEAKGISKVSSVPPFKDCFDAQNVAAKDTGLNVPEIEFGLPGKTGEVKWGFYGANTVVKVSDMVMCLAFYDGGMNPKDWIVIGTHQFQDYLLEFDLSTSVFSFSDSLLLSDTTCSTWSS